MLIALFDDFLHEFLIPDEHLKPNDPNLVSFLLVERAHHLFKGFFMYDLFAESVQLVLVRSIVNDVFLCCVGLYLLGHILDSSETVHQSSAVSMQNLIVAFGVLERRRDDQSHLRTELVFRQPDELPELD